MFSSSMIASNALLFLVSLSSAVLLFRILFTSRRSRIQSQHVATLPWWSCNFDTNRALRANQVYSYVSIAGIGLLAAVAGALGLAGTMKPTSVAVTKIHSVVQCLLRFELGALVIYIYSTRISSSAISRPNLCLYNGVLASILFCATLLSLLAIYLPSIPTLLTPLSTLLSALSPIPLLILTFNSSQNPSPAHTTSPPSTPRHQPVLSSPSTPSLAKHTSPSEVHLQPPPANTMVSVAPSARVHKISFTGYSTSSSTDEPSSPTDCRGADSHSLSPPRFPSSSAPAGMDICAQVRCMDPYSPAPRRTRVNSPSLRLNARPTQFSIFPLAPSTLLCPRLGRLQSVSKQKLVWIGTAIAQFFAVLASMSSFRPAPVASSTFLVLWSTSIMVTLYFHASHIPRNIPSRRPQPFHIRRPSGVVTATPVQDGSEDFRTLRDPFASPSKGGGATATGKQSCTSLATVSERVIVGTSNGGQECLCHGTNFGSGRKTWAVTGDYAPSRNYSTTARPFSDPDIALPTAIDYCPVHAAVSPHASGSGLGAPATLVECSQALTPRTRKKRRQRFGKNVASKQLPPMPVFPFPAQGCSTRPGARNTGRINMSIGHKMGASSGAASEDVIFDREEAFLTQLLLRTLESASGECLGGVRALGLAPGPPQSLRTDSNNSEANRILEEVGGSSFEEPCSEDEENADEERRDGEAQFSKELPFDGESVDDQSVRSQLNRYTVDSTSTGRTLCDDVPAQLPEGVCKL